MEIGELVFQDWKVKESIGEGGFGRVYKITRDDFGRTYEAALKIIEIPHAQSEIEDVKADGLEGESITAYFHEIVEDLVEEFALMSKLKGNSNIVSYEDHKVINKKGSFGWDIYIRMELLTPLLKHLKTHSFSVNDVIQMGIDICSALEICQKYNIIHRDIKPENIFVSDVGNYKLGDFGIARQLEKTSSGLSKKGTFTYMAPEVYKGQAYNSTVDIYSLGIVLYRYLNNNRTPFMPAASTQILFSDRERANILRFAGEPLPKPCNADGRLAEIVLKACAYDPKERYESASEMKKALQEVLYSEEGKVIYTAGEQLKNESEKYIEDFRDIGKGNEDIEEEEETRPLFEQNIVKGRKNKDKKEEQIIEHNNFNWKYKNQKAEKNSQVNNKVFSTRKEIKTTEIAILGMVVCIVFISVIVGIKNINAGKNIRIVEEQNKGDSHKLEIEQENVSEIDENDISVTEETVQNILNTDESISVENVSNEVGDDTEEKQKTAENINVNEDFTIIEGLLTEYTGRETDIVIPETVTAIDEKVFYNNETIRKVEIPEGVQGIGARAFYGCKNLKEVSLPESLQYIDDYAFGGCELLSKITLPDSLAQLGKYSFSKCKSLVSISIPGSVSTIEEDAFYDCDGLVKVEILDGVSILGKNAFSSCSKITQIVIPDSVVVAESGVFNHCSLLSKVILSQNMVSIPDSMFNYCKALKNIEIPSGVTDIGGHAFGYCSELDVIIIPESVEIIESSTFYGCKNFTIQCSEGTYAYDYAVDKKIRYEI